MLLSNGLCPLVWSYNYSVAVLHPCTHRPDAVADPDLDPRYWVTSQLGLVTWIPPCRQSHVNLGPDYIAELATLSGLTISISSNYHVKIVEVG